MMRNPLAHWRRSLPVSIQTAKHPFSALQASFDRMLEDFYKDFENFPASSPSGELENFTISPSIDIIDNKDLFKIEAEVPGMGPEDLKISVTDHTLTIKGEKTTARKDKDQNYLMREIAYGAYQRSIPLPESVDTKRAKATFKKGMLWVEIPKKPEASEQYREIKVEQTA